MSHCFVFESSPRQRTTSAASAAEGSAVVRERVLVAGGRASAASGFSRPWFGLLAILAREISEPVRFLISAARLGGLVSKNESSS